MKVLELFSGCGGAALGLSRAGWKHLACVEWSEAAANTLKAAGFPALHNDVRNVDYAPFVKKTDLLWASPPCQAGSTLGRRKGAQDDRNGWPWTMDVIDEVQPTWLLAENVLGWTYHRKGCARQERRSGCVGCYWEQWIVPELQRRFAFVGWWKMNAADYGTPQHRRRVLLWAGPLPLASAPPPPSHLDPEDGVLPDGIEPWSSVRQSIGETLHRGSCDERRCYPCDGSHGQACSQPWRLDRPSPAVVAGEFRGTRANAVIDWEIRNGPDRASDAAFLIAGIRRITVQEGLVLQGFPADWPLQGNVTEQYRQVGNAVPPQVAEAAGRAVAFAEQVRRRLPSMNPVDLADALRLSGQTLPSR